MNEFDFIGQYLLKNYFIDETLLLGIGDDAATLKVSEQKFWHISTDMLLADRHFFANELPQNIAYKSLAVNFSDIASMGAIPKWVLLSLALPRLDMPWLDAFFSTFHALLNEYKVKLIGGDTTKGDTITINITIIGESSKLGLQRNHAKLDDDIWVTGRVGLATAALYHHWNRVNLSTDEFEICEQIRVKPRIRLGFMSQARDLIHAAQDVSDGLVQDLGHILTASQLGAKLNVETIPSLDSLNQYAFYYDWILNGGDDYEIIFTAAKNVRSELKIIAKKNSVRLYRIGEITKGSECLLFNQGKIFNYSHKGFDHFEN